MNDQLMLEYIFFHPEPYRLFKHFLISRNVQTLQEKFDQTDVEALVICIDDNLDDALSDEIESYYDEMMELNETLVTADGEMNNVGLTVTLSDGRSVLASVEPDVMNRILTVISHQELGQLVDKIADAVENPDARPLCKRQ
jgi:hypothetical protein